MTGAANYDWAEPVLVNVDISDNLELSTSSWGSGLYEEGDGTIRTSWGNIWGHTSAVYNMTDPTGTGGNIASDPRYLDTSAASALSWDLRLDAGSPLIDAGDPSILDVDGSPSDIGAYGGPGGESW